MAREMSLEDVIHLMSITNNNQENNMSNNGTTKTRGRRSPLINIGKRLDKYVKSSGHYMTTKERNLMRDVAGMLMVEGEFGSNELGFIVDSIRKVSVAHSDMVLQRLADQAARWIDELSASESALDIAIDAAREEDATVTKLKRIVSDKIKHDQENVYAEMRRADQDILIKAAQILLATGSLDTSLLQAASVLVSEAART